MAKLKTKSAAKKRFKKVGKNKTLIKRGKGFRRHLLTKKSSKRKRDLRGVAYLNGSDAEKILKMLPY